MSKLPRMRRRSSSDTPRSTSFTSTSPQLTADISAAPEARIGSTISAPGSSSSQANSAEESSTVLVIVSFGLPASLREEFFGHGLAGFRVLSENASGQPETATSCDDAQLVSFHRSEERRGGKSCR